MANVPDFAPATVRHVSADHVTISPGPGYSVTVFNVNNEDVEAIVAADDGQETIRLKLEKPGPNRTMVIKKHDPTGITDIVYKARDDL